MPHKTLQKHAATKVRNSLEEKRDTMEATKAAHNPLISSASHERPERFATYPEVTPARVMSSL